MVRGTSQNPDAYFQSREAVEPFYARFPAVLDHTMTRFAALTGRRCRLFVIDGYGVSEQAGLGRRINTVMQICFFALAKVLPLAEALQHVRRSIEATWGRPRPGGR